LARGVVHATTLQVSETGQVKASVPDAAGDDHRGGDDIVLVVERVE